MAKFKLKYKSVRVYTHILVWVLYFLIVLLPVLPKVSIAGKWYYIIHMLILVAAVYINLGLFVRRFFYEEKYLKYILSVLLLTIVGSIAIYTSGLLLNFPAKEYFIKKTISAIMGFAIEFLFLCLYKVAKEWYLKAQKAKELHYEKMQAELGLLRSQLDAHFLFNTLNNIYLLVLKKSDKAPDAVLRLSDLLSYNIYDGHQEKVKLSKELGFIENYISLQKLRLDNSQIIHYGVRGDVNGVIEPLILFNYIENAFKHAYGMVVVDEVAYYVYIDIELKGDVLILKTINRYKKRVTIKGDKSGIGNNNTIKRLKLTYGDNYSLNISTEQQMYNVTLTINKIV